MNVYILTTYEYDTYSYSGVSESDHHIHATREGAEDHAKEMGLEIAEWVENPNKYATITETKLLN